MLNKEWADFNYFGSTEIASTQFMRVAFSHCKLSWDNSEKFICSSFASFFFNQLITVLITGTFQVEISLLKPNTSNLLGYSVQKADFWQVVEKKSKRGRKLCRIYDSWRRWCFLLNTLWIIPWEYPYMAYYSSVY